MASKDALTAFAVVTSAACSLVNGYDDPAVVGRWRSSPHSMEVELDGSGEAEIHFETGRVDRFDVEWEHAEVDVFELRLDCASSSDPPACLDVELECEVDEDAMTCSSPQIGNLESFEWSRR